jgi:hypothetical protein
MQTGLTELLLEHFFAFGRENGKTGIILGGDRGKPNDKRGAVLETVAGCVRGAKL